MNPRAELINKINEQQLLLREDVLPVVALEDFFSGNSDYGSIGCNLPDCPGPQAFFIILAAVRDKSSVQEVLVEINEVVDDDADQWPFSDRIYVLASASIDDVRNWLEPLSPDEVSEGWNSGTPPTAPELKPNVRVFAAWWD